MDLMIEIKREAEKILIKLAGEADVYASPEMKEELYKLLEEKPKSIVIDCSELNYIDSTGLSILIGLLKRQKEHGGDVQLLSLQPHVRKIFNITSLDKVFGIEG